MVWWPQLPKGGMDGGNEQQTGDGQRFRLWRTGRLMDGESENKIRKEKKKSYVGLFFDGGVTQTCHVCDMKNNNEAYSIFFLCCVSIS
jgi:hypothetical protein